MTHGTKNTLAVSIICYAVFHGATIVQMYDTIVIFLLDIDYFYTDEADCYYIDDVDCVWGGNMHDIMLVYIDYTEIVAVWKANPVSKIKLKLKVINNRLQKSGLLVIKSEAWICSNNLLYVSCFYGLDPVREFYMICFLLDHICSGISAHWWS